MGSAAHGRVTSSTRSNVAMVAQAIGHAGMVRVHLSPPPIPVLFAYPCPLLWVPLSPLVG